MINLYILEGHHPIPVLDLGAWARWFEHASKRVAVDVLPDKTEISTVFLGVDHNYLGKGPPLLFETMIFGGKYNQEQWRCSTWHQAEAQHKHAYDLARGVL